MMREEFSLGRVESSVSGFIQVRSDLDGGEFSAALGIDFSASSECDQCIGIDDDFNGDNPISHERRQLAFKAALPLVETLGKIIAISTDRPDARIILAPEPCHADWLAILHRNSPSLAVLQLPDEDESGEGVNESPSPDKPEGGVQ